MNNQKASINPIVEIKGYNLRQLTTRLKHHQPKNLYFHFTPTLDFCIFTLLHSTQGRGSSISIRNNIHFPFLPGIEKQPGRHADDGEKHKKNILWFSHNSTETCI